uniref:HAD hydrolase-like protein n=1 Tax=Salmonella enterica TaxID=28901 RepID=UPI00398C534F
YCGHGAERGTVLFPYVAETRRALQASALSLGLVTNKPKPFVAPLLESLDIAKCFSVVIGGDDVQNKKPPPEPLLLVASLLGLMPEQMLFVSLSRHYIPAANAAGFPSVAPTSTPNYCAELPSSRTHCLYALLSA